MKNPETLPRPDSLDSITVVLEGPGDTTSRPIDPSDKYYQRWLETKKLLEEREKKKRQDQKPSDDDKG